MDKQNGDITTPKQDVNKEKPGGGRGGEVCENSLYSPFSFPVNLKLFKKNPL